MLLLQEIVHIVVFYLFTAKQLEYYMTEMALYMQSQILVLLIRVERLSKVVIYIYNAI